MDGTDRADGEGRAEWSLTPAWTRVGVRMGRVVVYLLFGAAYLCDVAAVGSVAFVILLLTLMVAVPFGRVVYESGRYVAARRSGMVVVAMRIGAVDILPRRVGSKLRWKRYIHPLPAGYVYALPDPSQPLRLPMIRFALGGVASTVTVAVLVALTIPLFQTDAGRWSMAGVVAVLLTPLSSLFPSPLTPAGPILEAAGVMAWRWWKHPPSDAWMARTLALSRMVRGTPFSSLGQADLDMLLDESISGVWFALKRHQQRGEWELATELRGRLDDLLPVQRYAKSRFAELIDLMRSEMAFSAAVVHRDVARLPTPDALRRSRRGDSSFAARCEAWRAHLVGDGEASRRATKECIRVADNSVDRSLVASERLIAGQLYGDIEFLP